MNLKRTGAYAAVAALGFVAGNRIENYRSTKPLQAEVYQLRQDLEEGREKLQENDARLGKYTIRFADGRLATLNPDMSVTISGIAGEKTFGMKPEDFRAIKR